MSVLFASVFVLDSYSIAFCCSWFSVYVATVACLWSMQSYSRPLPPTPSTTFHTIHGARKWLWQLLLLLLHACCCCCCHNVFFPNYTFIVHIKCETVSLICRQFRRFPWNIQSSIGVLYVSIVQFFWHICGNFLHNFKHSRYSELGKRHFIDGIAVSVEAQPLLM